MTLDKRIEEYNLTEMAVYRAYSMIAMKLRDFEGKKLFKVDGSYTKELTDTMGRMDFFHLSPSCTGAYMDMRVRQHLGSDIGWIDTIRRVGTLEGNKLVKMIPLEATPILDYDTEAKKVEAIQDNISKLQQKIDMLHGISYGYVRDTTHILR